MTLLCILILPAACKDPVQAERDRIKQEFDSVNNEMIRVNRDARTENEKLLDAFDSLENAQK
jgi:hypothetical protein